ncbi:hypothetical protein AGLY_016792 [Aphis glycines]|uniref:Uncharacterized protein n=1 Tax=Aphis glycines TaxID=307491 RepID=A0A6G0SWQ8_APHGL|nr:hypothetical protein AGLY_016792 [Aphis glycines]
MAVVDNEVENYFCCYRLDFFPTFSENSNITQFKINVKTLYLASLTMSTNLRKLTKKRNNYKASINQINDFVKAYNSTIQSTRQVSTRLSKLNDLMDSFAKVQEDIIELDEGEDDDDEYLKYQDIYCTVKANMEGIIAKHGVPEAAASTNLSRSSVCDSIRLPTIKPPEFNGSLEDWASFIDTFNALFHNNSSLSDVVSGPAADIIKNFTITAENYPAAYNELVRQYENKSLTIQSHIRSLLQTPKVQVPSAVELRNLHHHISSHVRALKALGQPVMHWDAWLVTLICSQLDSITAGESLHFERLNQLATESLNLISLLGEENNEPYHIKYIY